MKILCETSMRHVHLSQADLETLFGEGAKLTVKRWLSQPNQFLAEERVSLIGPKRSFEEVAIIGPVRKESQVEISRTDVFALGLKEVPIRQSGDLEGAPTVLISVGDRFVNSATIIAKRHVHLTPETAEKCGICDGQIVSVKSDGARGGVLGDVVARVSETFADAVHIDSDEANAILAKNEIDIII